MKLKIVGNALCGVPRVYAGSAERVGARSLQNKTLLEFQDALIYLSDALSAAVFHMIFSEGAGQEHA